MLRKMGFPSVRALSNASWDQGYQSTLHAAPPARARKVDAGSRRAGMLRWRGPTPVGRATPLTGCVRAAAGTGSARLRACSCDPEPLRHCPNSRPRPVLGRLSCPKTCCAAGGGCATRGELVIAFRAQDPAALHTRLCLPRGRRAHGSPAECCWQRGWPSPPPSGALACTRVVQGRRCRGGGWAVARRCMPLAMRLVDACAYSLHATPPPPRWPPNTGGLPYINEPTR